MKDIKLREAEDKDVKTVDRTADLAERIKKALVRTADQMQNLTDDGQETPNEYAGDKLQYGMEDIASEAGHIVVDTGKGAYRTGKSAIQKFREKRRAEAEQRRQELENETPDTPVDEPTDPVTPDQPGPATPPESPVEEEVVAPSGNQQRRNTTDKTPTGDGPKGKLNPAKDGADAIQKEQQIKGPAQRRNSSIKALQKTEKTIKQSTRTAEQSAKTLGRSVKGTQKAVKTAEQSSKVAIITAQETAHAAQKSAQAAAKAAEKAVQIARATAKAAAAAAKACVAAVKELVAAIAAGGWVAVIIIIVIMVIALLVGSGFGIFSGEDTGSAITLRSIVQEIHTEYLSSLESIRNTTDHDRVEFSGSMAAWPEVLSVYTVKVNTDPSNPQDVASMDNRKKAILMGLFWTMNQINHKLETTEETVLVEVTDEDGNIIVTETTETVTTLYITITHKTAAAMAHEHGFTEEQKQLLTELLQDENVSMWETLLHGLPSVEEQFA